MWEEGLVSAGVTRRSAVGPSGCSTEAAVRTDGCEQGAHACARSLFSCQQFATHSGYMSGLPFVTCFVAAVCVDGCMMPAKSIQRVLPRPPTQGDQQRSRHLIG